MVLTKQYQFNLFIFISFKEVINHLNTQPSADTANF
jgi:hypothetical protein